MDSAPIRTDRAGCGSSAYWKRFSIRSMAHGCERMSVSQVAEGAFVAPGAQLAAGVEVQTGAVIHDGVVVGADCLIESGAILGKQPRLRPESSAASEGPLGSLVLDRGVTVCCGAVVYAGAHIGPGAI